ncbi:MAG: hypothetical protein QOH52_4335, partial [Pseudonocardiales bacterium]|nr:hypothetical protein [Pseudonocardiales bacterium]
VSPYDADIKSRVCKDMLATAPKVAAQAARPLAAWDRDRALAELDLPITTYEATRLRKPPSTATLTQSCEIRPVEVGGHFFFIEHPRVAADAIMRLPASARIATGSE